MEDVLILHNTFGYHDDSFYISRKGIMDQVHAVVNSLEELNIEYEVIPVRDLCHLTQVLPAREEKLVFNLIEDFDGSINHVNVVPALYEAFGFGYTGNGTETLFLSLDKTLAKAVLVAAGLPCPAGISISRFDVSRASCPRFEGETPSIPERTTNHENRLPKILDNLKKGKYIIKPACSDASEGIEIDSVVNVPSPEAVTRIKWIHEKFNQAAIIEQYIPSRELNVSVIETESGVKVLPIAEIDFSAFSKKQLKIVGYKAKWINNSFEFKHILRIIPAPLDETIAEKVRSLAIQSWQALGCHGYARVDFRLDENDSPYVLEVNPNPDISPDAGLAAALAADGIPYPQFVLMMLQNAIRKRDKM